MSDYEHLVGHRFPGGTHDLRAYESWLWADASMAAPDPDVAHPGIAYMIALHGGGASISDILSLFDSDLDSGVMFGECAFDLAAPIPAAGTIAVEGEVLAVERKDGRRMGPFDRVTFRHRLSSDEGEPLATVTHTWVLPRPEIAR